MEINILEVEKHSITIKEVKLTINRINKLLSKYENPKNFSYFTKEQREENIQKLKKELEKY